MRAYLLATIIAAGAGIQPALAADLSKDAQAAIAAALEDEHRAEAFYAAVIDKFGEVCPFANIIRAEQTHAAELGRVMDEYGMEHGSNPYLGEAAIVASVPESLAEACAIGRNAEIANRDLYHKRLMPTVEAYPDIKVVFAALRDASENKHLPAFERCGGGQGNGKGMGMGMGMGKRAQP